jgi:hypothetical protein
MKPALLAVLLCGCGGAPDLIVYIEQSATPYARATLSSAGGSVTAKLTVDSGAMNGIVCWLHEGSCRSLGAAIGMPVFNNQPAVVVAPGTPQSLLGTHAFAVHTDGAGRHDASGVVFACGDVKDPLASP